jgi:hypothetical protein
MIKRWKNGTGEFLPLPKIERLRTKKVCIGRYRKCFTLLVYERQMKFSCEYSMYSWLQKKMNKMSTFLQFFQCENFLREIG